MVNTIVSIPGYVHLYRSLLRFYDMPENEVREMLYLLNKMCIRDREQPTGLLCGERHCL